MKFVEHKLATGAMLTGYLRDETTEMPSYNTRPAVLILPHVLGELGVQLAQSLSDVCAFALTVPLVLQVGLLGLGCGIIVSSLTTRYRDLMVVVTFGVQLWMYGSPVVYPLSMIDNRLLRAIMIVNPMTAPMESFRYIFFGTGQVNGLMWVLSLAWTAVLLVVGLSLFSKVEKTFVDTV